MLLIFHSILLVFTCFTLKDTLYFTIFYFLINVILITLVIIKRIRAIDVNANVKIPYLTFYSPK